LDELSNLEIPAVNLEYGLNLNDFHVVRGEIEPNQFLADILLQHRVSYQHIGELAAAAKDVFDVRNLRAGKPYTVLSRDTSTMADYFIYEPNVLSYVVYSINDKQVELVEREIFRRDRMANGTISSSLWQTMIDQDLDYELAAKMEDALAWSIDFHHIQKGDAFKVFYEELFIGDKQVGVGKLHGAYFTTSNNDYYAIKFDSEKYDGYYDLEGRPMKKVFLKAPVKYTRISSKYNLRRFHPVLRRVKAHLGTDYAAPYGTPIYAVANGVVTKAGYTKGNGNYVKIKHDKVYSTQYLHMQKFAKGISSGVQVKQGQVIGYVGSTGLATGPHVCFRFWKDGRQVNHLRENLPEPDPMPEEELPKYFVVRDSIQLILDQISLDPVVASEASDATEAASLP
jgi:murein DD-endopeptidase MepM/ murein hydrolase activator NlpD